MEDIPTPTAPDFADWTRAPDAGAAPTAEEIAEWQANWVASELAESSEEPWWGIWKLTDSHGCDAFIATLTWGYSFSIVTTDIVGGFRTRAEGYAALDALGTRGG